MPGDTVRMSVFAKYNQPTKTKESITGMAGVIASTISQGADADAVMEVSKEINKLLVAGEAGVLAKDNNVPKAYLNYIFFDKEMNGKATNFKQVTEAAHGSFEKLEMQFIAEEEGYLMAYTSNQTNENLNVFMDQMSLTHTTGPIVRVDDYYPFGLTFYTSELDNKLTNKFLYNGKELQTDLDLNWYDYIVRQYDPAIGRFLAIDPAAGLMRRFSPYAYAFDNPVRFTDPDGMIPFDGVERRNDFDDDSERRRYRPPIEMERAFCKDCDKSINNFSNYVNKPQYIAGNENKKKDGDDDPKPKKKKSRAASIMASGLLTAAVTSQLDSPIPGPADVVAVIEIVGFGIVATGVLIWDAVYNSDAVDAEDTGAQDKKLSPGEIQKLKDGGYDPHELKGGKSTGQTDLYKTPSGDIVVKGKGGKGPGEPTGININDL